MVLTPGIGVGWLRSRHVRKAWTGLAEHFDFDFENGGLFGYHSVSGTLEGKSVSWFIQTPQAGVKGRIYTVGEVELLSEPPGELMVMKRTFQLFGWFVERRGIDVGDEDLDRACIIHCKDKDAARQYLKDPRVKDALLRLMALGPRPSLTEGRVQVKTEGLMTNLRRFKEQTSGLVAVASQLDQLAGPGHPTHSAENLWR